MNQVCPPPASSQEAPIYAGVEEVRTALRALTLLDFKRLYVIAEIHCRAYGLPPGHLEARDLPHEAVVRTFEGRKQWRHGVSLLHHLDRAMENIAGHEIPKLRRRVEASASRTEDEEEGDDPLDRLRDLRNYERAADAKAKAHEAAQGAWQLFEDDSEALAVLAARAQSRRKRKSSADWTSPTPLTPPSANASCAKSYPFMINSDQPTGSSGTPPDLHRAFCDLIHEADEAELDHLLVAFHQEPPEAAESPRAVHDALATPASKIIPLPGPQSSPTQVTRRGFGRLVRMFRCREELTVVELAKRADVSAAELSQIEQQPDYLPKPRTLFQLERFFGLPPDFLGRVSGVIVDARAKRETHAQLLPFAACADDLGKLTEDEKHLLNQFVAYLACLH